LAQVFRENPVGSDLTAKQIIEVGQGYLLNSVGDSVMDSLRDMHSCGVMSLCVPNQSVT
jgi:hypothetical protein